MRTIGGKCRTAARRFNVLGIMAVAILVLAGPSPAAVSAPAPGFTATAGSAGLPAKPSFCSPSNPFGKAHVCVEEYALCISAPCQLTGETGAHGKPTASCVCEVIHGASIGQGTCAERQPKPIPSQHMSIISTYSFQQTLPDYKLMTCPNEANGTALRYADCYNQKCIVDLRKDPGHAVCTCPVFEAGQGTFITRGGNCDTSKCATTIFSGAPTVGNELVNWQLACDIGLPHPPDPFSCGGQ